MMMGSIASKPKIMVAPNGARRQLADHPQVPVSFDAIIQTAYACRQAGAKALHLHIRDAAMRHTLDADEYRRTLNRLAVEVPDLELQITTESAGIFDVWAQYTCLHQVKPAWASIALREIMRMPDLAARVYGCAAEQGTRVQHIIYAIDDLTRLLELSARGIVPAIQNEVLFVLGAYDPQRIGQLEELAPLVALLPQSWRWSVCAFGAGEQVCLLGAAALGADWLRVGFENNVTRPDGHAWHDNAEAVAALHLAMQAKGYLDPCSLASAP